MITSVIIILKRMLAAYGQDITQRKVSDNTHAYGSHPYVNV
jgi:hypothetical protein